MFYVFICPGMPFRGDTLAQGKSLGGSETACYYMARETAARGHRVTVFTEHAEAVGKWDGVDYAPCGPMSERHPLGEYAHSFMENAECDVLVVQRAAGVFRTPHAAKVAFWWLHDLALMRSGGAVRNDAPQYDGVLAVSEWHKAQVRAVWNFPETHVHVLRNAVDRALYDGSAPERQPGQFLMLYQSRYERGIDHLIRPGGIMDQLAKQRPNARLLVCGYENEPDHMQGYYNQVRGRIAQMPNVTLLGHLGKRELAMLQRTCDVLVYPSTFEETSCITAMEAQCAGLPFIGCEVGALPETCAGGGAVLLPLIDDKVDEAAFVDRLVSFSRGTGFDELREAQSEKSRSVSWATSAEQLESYAKAALTHKQRNPFSMLRTMLDRSDAVLARKYVDGLSGPVSPEAAELALMYGFAASPALLAEHYDADHALQALDEDKNLDISQNSRYRFVLEALTAGGKKPSNLLDYGCQKGHYVYTLAKDLGNGVRLTGADVSKRHVDWANDHFAKLGLDHCSFRVFDALQLGTESPQLGRFDALVLGEVIEHVVDPVQLCQALEPYLLDGARVVVTTPYGEWEGKDYHDKPGQPRYHLHHFELTDLHDAFGHHEDFSVVGVAAGTSPHANLGSYVVSFTYRTEVELMRPVDYERKLTEYAPRETVSVCMLVRNAERSLLKTLHSVKDVADEFVIALDRKSDDSSRAIIERFADEYCRFKRVQLINAESPLDIGFDAARNRTVDQARGDWILWIDADEELIHPERLHRRFLRSNMFDGYGIAQHHMSAEPAGVLTTDWPVRLFRRNEYLRFSGVVHEHPDDIERPNSGPRSPAQLTDVCIVHHGYTTEEVRRARFHRNLPLIRRDRAQNPDRVLGRMLWMRDTAHMCMFGLEQTGGAVTEQMREVARTGIAEWEALLADGANPMTARMIRDGLEFYSTLVGVLGEGFEVAMQMHATKGSPARVEAGPRRSARFLNRAHLDAFMKSCVDEQVSGFDSKYF